MKKLNRGYMSFFETFFGKNKSDPNFPKGYGHSSGGHRYQDGADGYAVVLLRKGSMPLDQVFPLFQILGSMRPFAKMSKDFTDTFRPYASTGKFKRDLLQPIDGFINVAKGLGSIIGGSIALSLLLVILPITLVYPSLRYRLPYPISWIVEGTGNVFRGSLQLITTPLTYIFKIPLRGLLTAVQKKPRYVEDKPEIQRLASEALDHLEMVNAYNEPDVSKTNNYATRKKPNREISQSAREYVATIIYEINRKYDKSLKDGWAIRESTARQKFEACYSEFYKAASGSFWEKQEAPKEPITEDAMKKAREYLTFFTSNTYEKKKTNNNAQEKFNYRPTISYYGNKR